MAFKTEAKFKMKVLFICSEFYAGLLPYGSTIFNAYDVDKRYGIFVCTKECNYRNTIQNHENCIFIDYPSSKVKRILFRIFPFTLIKEILFLLVKKKIAITHLLTEDTPITSFVWLLKMLSNVYYTVHDFKPHEEKYSSVKDWLARTVFVHKRVQILIRRCDFLVTNSKFQYDLLLKAYPNKKILFHSFPSLITNSIKIGIEFPEELKGQSNYLLFFGRIDKYKGVEALYNYFINNSTNLNIKLVIAGSGTIYFTRQIEKEKNIIFLNRYIRDEEVNYIFKNSSALILPYLSATQTGVFSLAFYYKIPVICTNIPFFNEFRGASNHIHIFNLEKIDEELPLIINNIDFFKVRNEMTAEADSLFESNYSSSSLNKQLQNIYQNI